VFDGFNGLNTKPTRFALQDQEMYWCDGFMPFGRNTLRSMPGISSGIFTAPGGRTIFNFKCFNIGFNQFVILFLDDGSARIIENIAGTWTLVLTIAAATYAVTTASGYNNPYSVQWGSQYLLTIANNTYTVYDGSILYSSGATTSSLAPVVSISNVGSGYTSPTVVVAGGTGSGATFTATVVGGNIVSIKMTNAGSGYTVTDGIGSVVSILVTNAGTGGTNGTGYALTFTSAPAGGVTAAGTYNVVGGLVTNIVITNSGSGYVTVPTIGFAGGGAGAGAAATATLSISPATLALKITDATGINAAATVKLMPIGVTGSALETYAGRVWIVNLNHITYSSPGSFVDFSSVNGGGVITSTDSFLQASYINVFQMNGFLYIVSDSSVNYISNVQTTSTTTAGVTTTTTSFSNVNVDPQTGSIWRDSCLTYGRQILMLSSDGIHTINGGTVTKISYELDGIFESYDANTFVNFASSAAQAHIFGIHCYLILLPVTDPFTNTTTKKLVLFDGKKWWTTPQEAYLTYIGTFEFDSSTLAYGTDGTNFFQLVSNYNATLTKTFASKLHDKPSYMVNKRADRLLGMVQQTNTAAPALTISVDNQTSTRSYATSSLTSAKWTVSGQKWFSMNVEQNGYLLGLTVQTAEPSITLQSFMLVTQQYNLEI
jgi:hypothetical protein